MSDARLRLAIAALAALGAGIAAYLLAVKLAGTVPVCASGGCETVQQSHYSKLAGIPISAFGLAAYLVLFASAFARAENVRLGAAGLALAVAAVSAYLIYVQAAVIHAICQWCIASDTIAIAIAVLALARAGVLSRRPEVR